MYRKNMRFSLISLLLCLGFVSGVSAAPNVRVLGGNTANSSPKAAYIPVSGQSKSTATTGAVTKKSTVTKLSPSAAGQATIRQTAKMPTVSDSVPVKTANTERFPTVSSFGAAPTAYKVSTSNPSSSVALQGVNEKIENLSTDIADLQDKLAGEYMTADEISERYFDTDEMVILEDAIYTQINNLKETVENLEIQDNDTVYDYATQSRRRVSIVDAEDFVASEVLGDNNGLNN